MSRLLLDTQVVLWWDTQSTQLGKRARDTIRAAKEVYVSAASEWELTIKAGVGKLVLQRTIQEAVVDAGFRLLPVSFPHAQAVGGLPPIHKDPFDRILVATALVEGLTIVTSDPLLSDYAVRTLNATR